MTQSTHLFSGLQCSLGDLQVFLCKHSKLVYIFAELLSLSRQAESGQHFSFWYGQLHSQMSSADRELCFVVQLSFSGLLCSITAAAKPNHLLIPFNLSKPTEKKGKSWGNV